VELHRFLPGVRLRGAPGFATAEELAERDLLRSPTGALHGCWVPSRDVLGAHALVHGIAQHGLSPRSYPLMRMLADLVDLGWGAPGHGEAAAAAADLTARHVSRDEREAVLDLCRRLRAGEALPDRLTRRAGPAHRLLGHVLAGSLDPSYSDSLKLRALGSGPSLSPRPLVWLREAGRALFPGRARMEALHGEPVGRGASGMRRVLRLASMVWRAALALHGAWVTRTRPVLAIGALAARPGGAVESSLDTR
jgi:hypothetical protein